MTSGKALASMIDDLDPRPIYINSKDLHSTWCNSAALLEMGVQEMEDPAGGNIERKSFYSPNPNPRGHCLYEPTTTCVPKILLSI